MLMVVTCLYRAKEPKEQLLFSDNLKIYLFFPFHFIVDTSANSTFFC